jgi:hypothetical protein
MCMLHITPLPHHGARRRSYVSSLPVLGVTLRCVWWPAPGSFASGTLQLPSSPKPPFWFGVVCRSTELRRSALQRTRQPGQSRRLPAHRDAAIGSASSAASEAVRRAFRLGKAWWMTPHDGLAEDGADSVATLTNPMKPNTGAAHGHLKHVRAGSNRSFSSRRRS